MAVIPGEEQYSGIPSPRSGRAVARVDVSPLYQGAAQLGEGISAFGKGIQQLAINVADKRQKVVAYDTESRFQQFRFDEAKRHEEAMRTAPAGGVSGFADQQSASYRERARAFFQTVPTPLRGEYDNKLFATEREFYANGLEFEQGEMQRSSLQQTETTINNAILPQVVAAQHAVDPQGSLNAAIQSGTQLIVDNPYLTPIQKDQLTQVWRERAQRAFVEGLPADERAGWLGTEPADIADRIIQIESGGDPNAANPNSTAVGAGQFIEETWLGLLSRYRPDIADNPEFDRQGLLDLRNDPDLSREMIANYTAENSHYLESRGIAVTPGNVYLAHFLGPAGAAAVLSADPNLDMSAIVPDGVIAANRSVLEGKSAAEVIAWAQNKMGETSSTTSGLLDAIPYEDRQTLTADAALDVARETNAATAARTAAYQNQLNTLLVGVHDGDYGMSEINDARRSWLTDYEDITRVENAFKEANKVQLDLSAALQNFDNPDYQFSQYSEDDRDAVDLVYNAMGGNTGLLTGDDPEAQRNALVRLQGITQRTGIIPPAALTQLRTGIYSQDESIRNASFTILDGLSRQQPAMVENTLNEQDLARLRRYQELAPITTPERLNEALDPSQDPREVERRSVLRSEGRTQAGAVPLETILNAFDPSILPGDQPLQPIDPGQLGALREDFMTAYAEEYARSGNAEVAQRLALQALQMKWGQSDTGPERRLIAYPPENHYPEVDGDYDWMKTDLADFVHTTYGEDVLDFGVIPSVHTEARLDPVRGPDGKMHYTPYDVFIIDGDGSIRIERDFEFEYEKYRDEARAQFDLDRANAQRDRRFDMVFPAPVVPTNIPAGQPLVPIVPGTGNVPWEYNDAGIPVTRGTPLHLDPDAERAAADAEQAAIQQRGILFREQVRARAAAPDGAAVIP